MVTAVRVRAWKGQQTQEWLTANWQSALNITRVAQALGYVTKTEQVRSRRRAVR